MVPTVAFLNMYLKIYLLSCSWHSSKPVFFICPEVVIYLPCLLFPLPLNLVQRISKLFSRFISPFCSKSVYRAHKSSLALVFASSPLYFYPVFFAICDHYLSTPRPLRHSFTRTIPSSIPNPPSSIKLLFYTSKSYKSCQSIRSHSQTSSRAWKGYPS
jgi:hypothetical protein